MVQHASGGSPRPRIIDTDTHVVETKDLWTSRMPSKWKDITPHVRADGRNGAESWYVGDTRVLRVAFGVIYSDEHGGIVRREDSFPAFPDTFEDMHPSSYDP